MVHSTGFSYKCQTRFSAGGIIIIHADFPQQPGRRLNAQEPSPALAVAALYIAHYLSGRAVHAVNEHCSTAGWAHVSRLAADLHGLAAI